MKRKQTLFISLAILLGAVAVTAAIFLTEPKAQRSGATKETAMLVEVVDVDHGNYQPQIVATGVVVPARDIQLSSRVRGEVIYQSEKFMPGGYVKKGELLLRVDPADYENELEMRKSELLQAQADLDLEMGRQKVAEQDYELVNETLNGENEHLVLRQPQLNAAKSRVKAAEAAVSQAELNLNRTQIRAPFDAHILNRNVNLGSQVALGESLARLVGMDHYWVETSVPLSKLRWIAVSEDVEEATTARIRNRTAWKADEHRTGHVFKLIGSLEDQTRLARVLVEVPDPMAVQLEDQQPLMLGAFMEVTMVGREIENVIRLSRAHLRNNETVWVMDDGKLRIKDVDVLVTDADYAYIADGLSQADKVVTTNLSTVVDGAALRTESESETAQNDGGQQ